MTTPYRPVSFTNEQPTRTKMQQLANNQQWLFENMTRLRYAAYGLTRDSGLKILTGKTSFPVVRNRNYYYAQIYFGSFFSAGCKPLVIATVETTGGNMHRSKVVVQSRAAGGIDNTGFTAIVSTESYRTVGSAGWINWFAIGY